jgi:MFS family permease
VTARAALPRTVIALGLVSLFTDLSSEMIYPLLPAFLATVLAAGALELGLIEGVAESTAAILKLVSGLWTDRVGRRKPFVLGGYGLSGLVRPLIGLAGAWPVVLLLRFGDRVGKGLRTSPRDALIADAVDPAIRGRAYGFHRAMDHLGAVLGPLLAAGLLAVGMGLRGVFLLAVVPGLVVLGLILLGVREAPTLAPRERGPSLGSWAGLGPGFHRVLAVVVLFTLGNSTDAFLLLRLGDLLGQGEVRGALSWVALLWSAHHVVKLLATYAGGRLSDRLGRRGMIIAGWLVYAAVYSAFAWVDSAVPAVVVFLLYGVYFGLTEPVEKAWVADLVPAGLRGTAFGYYHGAVGLAALPASLLFGALWKLFGVAAAFGTGAALAGLSALLLAVLPVRAAAREAA